MHFFRDGVAGERQRKGRQRQEDRRWAPSETHITPTSPTSHGFPWSMAPAAPHGKPRCIINTRITCAAGAAPRPGVWRAARSLQPPRGLQAPGRAPNSWPRGSTCCTSNPSVYYTPGLAVGRRRRHGPRKSVGSRASRGDMGFGRSPTSVLLPLPPLPLALPSHPVPEKVHAHAKGRTKECDSEFTGTTSPASTSGAAAGQTGVRHVGQVSDRFSRAQCASHGRRQST